MPRPSARRLERLTVGLVLDDSLDRPDGVQQYVLTVGEWLRGQGHNVHYLASTTMREDIPGIHSLAHNVGVSFNGNTLRVPLPASGLHIHELLKREDFDVLHIQMPYSPLFAGRVIARVSPQSAVIGTFHIVPHNPFVGAASRLLAVSYGPTLRRFDKIFSTSKAAQGFARQAFGIKSDVMPNPVRLGRFKDAKPLGEHQGAEQYILFLGRLVQRKGCMLLLKAAAILKDDPSLPPFHITICGRGPLAPELESFVRDHGLVQAVTFKGFIDERIKPRYFASADIAVFPSTSGESFGIVLVEAIANGRTAVLAGDNVGYRSVLGDCPGDVLFDTHNAVGLAVRLKKLLTDKATRRHIAAWQSRHAQDFDINLIGPKLLHAYVSALQRRRSMR